MRWASEQKVTNTADYYLYSFVNSSRNFNYYRLFIGFYKIN